LARAKDAENQEPIAWGTVTHTGCVIFAEGRKTKGMFWGLAVTANIMGKLTTIETQNYTFDHKEVIETQDTSTTSCGRAQADQVKYLKIPKSTPPTYSKKPERCARPTSSNQPLADSCELGHIALNARHPAPS
jgi:hypothetical protein